MSYAPRETPWVRGGGWVGDDGIADRMQIMPVWMPTVRKHCPVGVVMVRVSDSER